MFNFLSIYAAEWLNDQKQRSWGGLDRSTKTKEASLKEYSYVGGEGFQNCCLLHANVAEWQCADKKWHQLTYVANS